jgi:quercetin dioxygenase-like cupin family protein
LYKAASLFVTHRGKVRIRRLLLETVSGFEIDRMELAAGAYMTGVPHTPGTREYLTCESGVVELSVAESNWLLQAGDVVVFRGDQKHAYRNPSPSSSVAYSVLSLAAV